MATTSKTIKTTPVTVKGGLATVYMHKDVGSVTIDGETFTRGKLDGPRVWSFTCSPETARALIEQYEFAAGSESGVALTVDEQREAQDLKSRSTVQVAKMAQALAQLADERVQRDES